MKVLVVDDSVVFRTQIKAALEGEALIDKVETANNGKIALQKLEKNPVDLITLDLEMPELDGLETLKEIRKRNYNTRVIMFSSHTQKGSEKTLEALSAGADDFVEKPSGEAGSIENAADLIKKGLIPKVRQFYVKATYKTSSDVKETAGKAVFSKKDLSFFKPDILVIGSSTGGPPALEQVLKELKAPLRCPVIIAQHMPPLFTASLAKRIGEITGIESAESKQMEILQNRIYVCPGDYHVYLTKKNEDVVMRLDQGPPINSVRPAVDPLFETAAEIYGPQCLGVILTGMGDDGRVGCEAIKRRSGGVMIQNEKSCVVFGMPRAVFEAGAYDKIGDLTMIRQLINTTAK